jgi:uncharacterized delta-60 repeat protein
MWRPTNGGLDLTFDGAVGPADGEDGLIYTHQAGDDFGERLVVDSSGRIIVVGTTTNANTDFLIARYLANGQLDGSFGTGGKTVVNISADDYAMDVALQSDGKILVSGEIDRFSGDKNIGIIRLGTDGTLDNLADSDPTIAWDTDGRVTFNPSNDNNWQAPLEVQADGRVIVATTATSSGNADWAIARYLSDGSLDPAFDGAAGATYTQNGVNCYPCNGWFALEHFNNWDVVGALAVQSDGKILVGGNACCTVTNDATIVRLSGLDGSLDTNSDSDPLVHWSTDGIQIADFGVATSMFYELLIEPSGSVVGVGVYGNPGSENFAIARYLSTGLLDAPTFSGDGMNTVSLVAGDDAAGDVVLQPDGKYLVAGDATTGTLDSGFARFDSIGGVDTTFGTGGTLVRDVSPGQNDYVWGIAWGSDGKLYAAGGARPGANSDFLLQAFDVIPVPQYADGSNDWSTGGSLDLFGACLLDADLGATGGGGGWIEDVNLGSDCADGDTDPWYAIPAAAPGAKVAFAAAPDAETVGQGNDPRARLRFGFRTRLNQEPGTYVAPIVFEAVAPNA